MSKEPYPSETADRFIVRFPDGMRDRIKEAAAANNRSMNAEIIARLEASFQPPPPMGSIFGLGTGHIDPDTKLLLDALRVIREQRERDE